MAGQRRFGWADQSGTGRTKKAVYLERTGDALKTGDQPASELQDAGVIVKISAAPVLSFTSSGFRPVTGRTMTFLFIVGRWGIDPDNSATEKFSSICAALRRVLLTSSPVNRLRQRIGAGSSMSGSLRAREAANASRSKPGEARNLGTTTSAQLRRCAGRMPRHFRGPALRLEQARNLPSERANRAPRGNGALPRSYTA